MHSTAEPADGEAMTPLDVMLSIMRFNYGEAAREIAKGEERDSKRIEKLHDTAAALAKNAAPYVHAKAVASDSAGQDYSHEDALAVLDD
jgi:hypothetical protein